ncbi:hypothetical protein GGR57DRAFT_483113 [Xylariaceae sp. FL1272]|nr:hypothetical protein GGR57DRAFT_483113 [Xylariaceae sp. FL1272]
MYSSRMVHILWVGLAFLLATRAAWQPRNVGGRDLIESLIGADDETTTSSTADATTSSDTTTSSEAPTTTTESTTESTTSDSSTSTTDVPTTSTTDEPTSSTPPPTTTTSTTDGGDSGSTTSTSATEGPTSTTATSTTADGQTGGQTTKTTETTSTAKPFTTTSTIVFTSTDSEGHTYTSSTVSQVVQTPGFSGSGSSSKNTGLSAKEKSTVIGVTVGVGGAIVLAAIGILFWRLRSKKRSNEEQEELVSYGDGFGGPGTAEKTSEPAPGASRSPFQSTLESYHAPSSTNAASNF